MILDKKGGSFVMMKRISEAHLNVWIKKRRRKPLALRGVSGWQINYRVPSWERGRPARIAIKKRYQSRDESQFKVKSYDFMNYYVFPGTGK